jgi:hypothetical protein
MATNPKEIQLSDNQRARLALLADQRGTRASEIIGELLEYAETVVGINRGLDSAARGEGIAADEVHDGLRRKFDL